MGQVWARCGARWADGQFLRLRASEGQRSLTWGTSSVSIVRDIFWGDPVVKGQALGCGTHI